MKEGAADGPRNPFPPSAFEISPPERSPSAYIFPSVSSANRTLASVTLGASGCFSMTSR